MIFIINTFIIIIIIIIIINIIIISITKALIIAIVKIVMLKINVIKSMTRIIDSNLLPLVTIFDKKIITSSLTLYFL